MSLLTVGMNRTTIDNIVEAVQKGDLSFLCAEDLEYYNAISFADDLLRDYKNHGRGKRHIAKMIQLKWNVSETTAYKYMNDAMYVFRTTNILDKDYWKQTVLDMQMNVYRLAMADASKNFKHANAAIANIIKILGFDKRDPEPVTADMLGQNNYYMVIASPDGKQLNKIDFKTMGKVPHEERMQLMESILNNTAYASFEEVMKDENT